MAVFYKDNQYMAETGSFFPDSVKINGDFLVGPRSTFKKDLVVCGNLYLCPECLVKGNIICYGGVVSRGCVIEGELKVLAGPTTLCDRATVAKVISHGDILVRPDVQAKEISGDTIIVMGKIKCGKLMGKKTRVVSTEFQ